MVAMAKFTVGEKVLVPATAVGWSEAPLAVLERDVIAQQKRKVKVSGKPGDPDKWVASRRVHSDIHILLLRLGDIDSEIELPPLQRTGSVWGARR